MICCPICEGHEAAMQAHVRALERASVFNRTQPEPAAPIKAPHTCPREMAKFLRSDDGREVLREVMGEEIAEVIAEGMAEMRFEDEDNTDTDLDIEPIMPYDYRDEEP